MATINYKQKIKDYMNSSEVDTLYKSMLTNLFPELKESEDERTRKEIITFIVTTPKERNNHKKWIAWLEKQGEHANFRNKIQIGDKVTRNEDGVLVNLSQLNRVAKKQTEQKLYVNDNAKEMFIKALERVEEQNNKGYKLTDCDKNSWWEDFKAYASCTVEHKPTDKVEPKFKVGDWVIDKQDIVHQIANIIETVTNHTYGYDIVGGGYFNDNTEGVRLWTIQDAKDGDVLATENFIFIFKNIDSGNGVHYYCHYEISKHEDDNQFGVALPQSLMGRVGYSLSHYFPATKEQRDTLIKAMADAGYTFDFKKKELKKIEQKPADTEKGAKGNDREIPNSEPPLTIKHAREVMGIKQDAAWSELDDVKINRIVACLENLNVADNDILLKDVAWLKSIKDRVQPQPKWKPSDEQMNALNYVVNLMASSERPTENDLYYNILKSLRQQLKKLMEDKLKDK